MESNKKFCDRFDQSNIGTIQRMFWLAATDFTYNSEFQDMLDEIPVKRLKELFPAIKRHGLREYRDCMGEAVCDSGRFGFLAEIMVYEHYNFKFKEGHEDYYSCSINAGIASQAYCYGETPEELMSDMETQAKAILQGMIDKEKK